MGYDEGPQVKESKVKCKRKVERDPNVLCRVIVDNEQLGGNPLTRPAPADESAGGGPPSPPRGRGAGEQGDIVKI
jgi:hypothetical protein